MVSEREQYRQIQLHDLAAEYERQGYRVLLHPERAALPDFLAEFVPPIVAFGAEQNVVADVQSREDLIGNAEFLALVAAVDATPGWRFDLSIRPLTEPPIVGKGAVEAGDDVSTLRLRSARELLAAGQVEAAFLLGWSALEHALRSQVLEYDPDLDRPHPDILFEQLVWRGLIGHDDDDFLREALRYRNLIVHGYRAPDDLDAFARRLLARAEVPHFAGTRRAAS